MEYVDVEHLAKLAKLSLTPAELAQYQKEITDILGYVAQVNQVAGDTPAVLENASVRNVMREDVGVMDSETYTDALLAAAPNTQDGFVKVQKILDTGHGA